MNSLFEGIRVVDFTSNVAGPFSTALLADYGAEVIKIEKPKIGDDTRAYAPQLDGVSLSHCAMNRGKKSIVLDMEDPEAVTIAKKLIETADLVAESFKPGTMDKFGLNYDVLKEINPRIILCSISAYGQTGPYSGRPGYDTIAQALSGVMDITGEPNGPPTRLGVMLADYGAGVFAYGAMTSALFHRERTGNGQHIDISLLDCLVSMNGSVDVAGLGMNPTRTGNHTSAAAPFGVFQGNGAAVAICAPAQKPWNSLCALMGRMDLLVDPLFSSIGARGSNRQLLIAEIEKWLHSFADIDEPLRLMDNAGIPCAKVNSAADVLENEQLQARGMVTELETPIGVSPARVRTRGNPLKFSAATAVLNKAPALGQHQEEVLRSIGYDETAIAELKQRWEV
jgi:crotonobetainyl-CoA:carnitine CoA-transferase CaiB-like acyl-CoA transferase